MNKNEIIQKVKRYVRKELGQEPTGHDFWHAFKKMGSTLFFKKSESKPKSRRIN
jgi:hypothetical protein